MKRDLDLMRETLLAIEQLPEDGFAREIDVPGRTTSDVNSAMKLLRDSEMIDVPPSQAATTLRVERLTQKGHDFLAEVRDEAAWHAAKGRALKVNGAVTMDSITESLRVVGTPWITELRQAATKWSPILVALLSLVVSASSVFWARDTSRRLVKPALLIGTSAPINPEFYFKNGGTGPAKIQWIRAAADQIGSASWLDLATLLGFNEAEIKQMHSTTPDGAFVLLPGEKFTMIAFPSVELLQRFTSHRALSLEICLCSIYDECETLFQSRSLGKSTPGCSGRPEDAFRTERNMW